MPAGYRYIGPPELAEISLEPPARVRVDSAQDVTRWLGESRQTLDADHSVVATFVIDMDGQLWIADRHSEHVQCARGQRVLSAGEMTFGLHRGKVEVVEVTNQSTGYCPEPESWPAVAAALEGAGLRGPDGFTSEFLFRRCPECGMISLVKDGCFECAGCANPLPHAWNCDASV